MGKNTLEDPQKDAQFVAVIKFTKLQTSIELLPVPGFESLTTAMQTKSSNHCIAALD
jgi:hypothetical protein